MAVDDHSFGPFYTALIPTDRRAPFVVGITQMTVPWRKGKALGIPLRGRALLLGLWFRLPKRKYQDWLGDEQWLRGRKLGTVAEYNISTWDRGPDDEAQEEETVFVSEPVAPDGESTAPGPQ